ncbi:transcriptional regulatory protein SrrA [Oxobacter pfennigii]|uniref:Stage 0 sporulation protein A homolog n=1 Tax=Oxobacter pfennigii TaxID=36849 RepID=A0A0P8W555_9CLOT|nr:response regulator transcription factor [Oxobacter pfennigii]KPU43741.1 transcriptional regulatory protein SrrA [Oxobacter pfennigii]
MQSVLIIDDDENVHEFLNLYLKKEGYFTYSAYNGIDAIKVFKEHSPSVIILDIMMPGLNGLEVCKAIRSESKVPIIMLTAKGEDIDKILGLEIGADDYITKPFNPREVAARIKAVLRRVEDFSGASNKILNYPGLEINLNDYTVKVNDTPIQCTSKEIEILWIIASKPNRVFTREQLLELVWGYEYAGETRTVDTHIKRIRAKLNIKDDLPWDIKTVWGVGYKFEVK